MTTNQHTSREAWLQAFADASRPYFAAANFPLPPNIRMSIGFPSSGKRSKAIGECWGEASSEDGNFEIFIKPTLDSAARIADVLTHELCHAAVGLQAKHGARFRRCATALGLESKMTATKAGDAWRAWALPVIEAFGPLPAAPMRLGGSSAAPKQSTRMLKRECNACGLTMRLSAKWAESATRCPDAACEGELA